MPHPRPGLALAALALAATLAACSDTGTTPQSRQDDPVVQRLNRLADGHGQVVDVKGKDEVVAGAPAAQPGLRGLAQQPCYETYDGPPCDPDPEPYDPTCYSNCSWFDAEDHIDYGTYPDGIKWAQLSANLFAYSGAAYASATVYYYSAGGCVSNPSLFDSNSLSGSNGPFTLRTYRFITYTGGTFTWAIFNDGYAQNRYGIDGYESAYSSLCA